MATTIQLSEELVRALKQMKLYDTESYEDLIWDLLEDHMELSEETKNNIDKSLKEIKAGKFKTLAQIKKELSL